MSSLRDLKKLIIKFVIINRELILLRLHLVSKEIHSRLLLVPYEVNGHETALIILKYGGNSQISKRFSIKN